MDSCDSTGRSIIYCGYASHDGDLLSAYRLDSAASLTVCPSFSLFCPEL